MNSTQIKIDFLESLAKISAITLVFVVLTNLAMHVAAWNMWSEALWYCDIAGLILGFAILTKNNFLSSSILAATIPVQSFWIIDFVLELFGHGYGRTAYMFEGMLQWNMLVFPVLLHASIIPLAALAVYLYGYNKRSIIFSLGFLGIILMTTTYIFTAPINNINCVFYPCDLNYTRDFTVIVSNSEYLHNTYFIKLLALWGLLISVSHITFGLLFNKN